MSQHYFYPPSAQVTFPPGDLDVNIDAVGGDPITLGQKPSADSFPVVLSTEQEAELVAIDDDLNAFAAKTAGAFISEKFDYADITYVGATTNIQTVVYKIGGSGGTTVATLTLGYDGSNRLNAVTKS